MKGCIFWCLLLFVKVFAACECLVDDSVIIRTLDNGFTYYIKSTSSPREEATLGLLVKVGSIYEENSEKGLAHYVEHVVFGGSHYFPGDQSLAFFKSLGIELGVDAGAVTNFESTYYYVTVPIEKKMEVLPQILLLLSDIAGRATFNESVLNRERSVIRNEALLRGKLQTKLSNFIYNTFFSHTHYEDHLPIGSQHVIAHCDQEQLLGFYHKYYDPSRMALFIVGDFQLEDEKFLEEEVKKCFGHFQVRKGGKHILPCWIQPNPERPVVFVDPQFPFFQASFWQFCNKIPQQISQEHIHEYVKMQMFFFILNNRLQDRLQDNCSPFLSASVNYQSMTAFHSVLSYDFVGFLRDPYSAICEMYKEIEKLRLFGPSQIEFDIAQSFFMQELRFYLRNLSRIPHSSYIMHYFDHFIGGHEILSLKKSFQEQLRYLSESILLDVVEWGERSIQTLDYPLLLFMPDAIFPENDIEKIRHQLQREVIKNAMPDYGDLHLEYEKFSEQKPLTILEREKNGDVQKVQLDNCMQVTLHSMSIEKGIVHIALAANGGRTLFASDDVPSSFLATSYFLESGLSNLNGSQLRNFLLKHYIFLDCQIRENFRLITISGPSEYSHILLQIIQSIFMHKRFDSQVWENMMHRLQEIERCTEKRTASLFHHQVIHALYGDQAALFYSPVSDQVSSEKAQSCACRAFSHPSEFHMAIVGDFDVEKMKKDMNQFLSFEDFDDSDVSQDVQILPYIQGQSITGICEFGEEDLDVTFVGYRNCQNIPFLQLEMCSRILSHRILQDLRFTSGDIYTVDVSCAYPLFPHTKEIVLKICFASESSKTERLQKMVSSIVDDFLKEGPTNDEIAYMKKIFEKKKKKNLESPLSWLSSYIQRPFIKVNESSPTKENVHQCIRTFMKDAQRVQLTLKKHQVTLDSENFSLKKCNIPAA